MNAPNPFAPIHERAAKLTAGELISELTCMITPLAAAVEDEVEKSHSTNGVGLGVLALMEAVGSFREVNEDTIPECRCNGGEHALARLMETLLKATAVPPSAGTGAYL